MINADSCPTDTVPPTAMSDFTTMPNHSVKHSQKKSQKGKSRKTTKSVKTTKQKTWSDMVEQSINPFCITAENAMVNDAPTSSMNRDYVVNIEFQVFCV